MSSRPPHIPSGPRRLARAERAIEELKRVAASDVPSVRLSATIGGPFATATVLGVQPDETQTDYYNPEWLIEDEDGLPDLAVETITVNTLSVDHDVTLVEFTDPGRYVIFARCQWNNGKPTTPTPNGPSYASLHTLGTFKLDSGAWAVDASIPNATLSGGAIGASGVPVRGSWFHSVGGGHYGQPEVTLSWIGYHHYTGENENEAAALEFFNTEDYTNDPSNWRGSMLVVRLGV